VYRFEHSRLVLKPQRISAFRMRRSCIGGSPSGIPKRAIYERMTRRASPRRSRHLGGASVAAVSLDWSTGLTATGRHRDNYYRRDKLARRVTRRAKPVPRQSGTRTVRGISRRPIEASDRASTGHAGRSGPYRFMISRSLALPFDVDEELARELERWLVDCRFGN